MVDKADAYIGIFDKKEDELDIEKSYLFKGYAYGAKGNALYELQRYEVVEAYDKTIEINPNDAKAWYNKGAALAKLQRYDEAIVCFDKVRSIFE